MKKKNLLFANNASPEITESRLLGRVVVGEDFLAVEKGALGLS